MFGSSLTVLFFAGLISLGATMPARADFASTGTVSLPDLMTLAREQNPEIRAFKDRWNAVRAQTSVEKSWDNPTLSYERMYSGNETLIGVEQMVPFPGKRRLKGQGSAQEAAMAEQEYRAKEREILREVRSAYAQYALAVKSIGILEENVELMRGFSKAAESKYAVGKARQTDVLKAQIELSKMISMQITLRQEMETAQAMLNTLMDLPPQNPMGAPQEPPLRRLRYSLEELQTLALDRRPELIKARHHVHHSETQLRLARLDSFPDFTAQIKRRSAANTEMDGTTDVMVGVTVPLWFGKQKSLVRSARFEKDVSEAEYRTERNKTLFGVKDLLVKLQAAERLAELYRTSVIPQAEQALEVSQAAYRSDAITFLELLDAQRGFLQFRIEHNQALVEYEQWAAQLEQMAGQDLWEERP